MAAAERVAGDWILGGIAHIEFARRNSAVSNTEIRQMAVIRTNHLATSVLSW